MEWLTQLNAWFEGKKTYAVALVAAVVAGAEAFGYPLPEYVLTFLVAVGLFTLRSAVAKAGG